MRTNIVSLVVTWIMPAGYTVLARKSMFRLLVLHYYQITYSGCSTVAILLKMIKLFVKKLFLLLLFTICIEKIHAQLPAPENPFRLPGYAAPSPTAASIGRYGEIPVTIQSGVPDIRIPIYEVATGKQKLPISISFHGGGIRVTDKAGPVGLGWALNAGGVINRVVQGIPDENNQYGFLKQVLDNDDPGFSEKLRCQAIYSQYITGKYQTDLQPDIFMYSLPGKSGKFMHKNKKYVDMHPGFMTIPYDPIKIDTNSINDGYFRITDSDGTEYMFGKGYEGNSCVEGFYRYEGFATWGVEHRAAWFLAGMVSSDKSDTIRFIYTTPGGDVTESRPVTLTGTVHDDTNPLSLQFSKSPANIKYDYTTNVRLLQTIRFKNGEVRFTYNANRWLQEMKVVAIDSTSEEQIFRWQFFRDAEKLDSVRQVGTNGVPLPAFEIDYITNTTGQYVRPTYNSNGRDLWGFYNGKDSNPDLLWVDGVNGMPAPISVIDRRMPDEVYMQYGQIKKITYPTGGSSEFFFEPNKTTRQTYRNDTIWNTMSHRVYTWIPTYGNAQPSVTFTVNQQLTTKSRDGGVQSNAELILNISRACTPNSPQQPWCVPNTVRVRLVDITSGQVLVAEIWLPAYSQQTSIEKRFFNLAVGHTYQLILPDPGNVGTGQMPQYNLDATVRGEQYLSHTTVPVINTILGGGMRIKQIIHSDGTGKRLMKEYSYPKSYWNSDYFNGDFESFANSTFAHERSRRGVAGAHDAPRPFYKTWHENLTIPLGSIYNTSLANEIVEEYDKNPDSGDTLGKIAYRFNVATDYVPRWMPFFKLDYDHVRNQLLTKKIYRNTPSGMQLIQSDSIIYRNLDDGLAGKKNEVRTYVSEVLWLGGDYDGEPSINFSANNCIYCEEFWNTRFKLDTFNYRSPRVIRSEFHSTTYHPETGNTITVNQKFDYDNLMHMLPTSVRSKNSKGDSLVNRFKRPQDYNYFSGCTNCEAQLDAGLLSSRSAYYTQQKQWLDSFYYYVRLRDAAYFPLYPEKINYAKSQFLNYQSQMKTLELTAANNNVSCRLNSLSCIANIKVNLSESEHAICRMQELYNIVPVIEEKAFTNNVLTSTKATDYFWQTGDYVTPWKVKASQLSALPEERLEFTKYEKGNPVQLRKSNDVPVSLIWGYAGTLLIGEVTGAQQQDVAYASFETGESGNWNLPSFMGIVGGITGEKYFSGTGFLFSKAGLSAGTKYIVTYWSRNGAYNIPGTQAGYPKLLRSIIRNGVTWTLQEHLVTGQSTLQVTGSGSIDELRLHPQDAVMRTFSFKPLLGMTSECSASHRLVLYDYDEFGRLRTMRDDEGNILRQQDYRFQLTFQP